MGFDPLQGLFHPLPDKGQSSNITTQPNTGQRANVHNDNIFDDIWNGIKDQFSHPFPTKAPHDPVGAAVASSQRKEVHVSDLMKKYTDWDWRVATAIALAESRGKIDATHTNSDGSTDNGLMQINSVHSQYDINRLKSDAEYNVAAGHDIWKAAGGSFSPWTTYKSGAYLAFMGHDATVNTVSGGTGIYAPGVNQVTDAASGGLDAIGSVIGALGNPSTWLRLGKGALGGVLIIAGAGAIVFTIASKTNPVAQVAKKLT